MPSHTQDWVRAWRNGSFTRGPTECRLSDRVRSFSEHFLVESLFQIENNWPLWISLLAVCTFMCVPWERMTRKQRFKSHSETVQSVHHQFVNAPDKHYRWSSLSRVIAILDKFAIGHPPQSNRDEDVEPWSIHLALIAQHMRNKELEEAIVLGQRWKEAT